MSSKKGAYLVELVSGKRISITLPACKLIVDRKSNVKKAKAESNSGTPFEIKYDQGHYTVSSLAKHDQEQVYLNGAMLIGPRPINNGDSLTIGKAFLWFVIED